LVAAAGVLAFLYAAAVVWINLFPFFWGWNPYPALSPPHYDHGWPLVYMVRDGINNLRTFGCGPWPLDDCPLLQFRPTLLLLNILCGGVLALSATVAPVYWLRVRRRPFQFSLRALLGTITVVACLLGMLKWYNPRLVSVKTALGLLLVVLPQVLLCALPTGLILVAAHWAAGRTADCPSRGRWRGIHWLSWLAVAAVGIPFLHDAFLADTRAAVWGGGALGRGGWGWPLRYEVCLAGDPVGPVSFPAFAADLAVWLLVVAATGFVAERWVRRVQQRTAMRPSAVLGALLVTGVVVWIVSLDDLRRPAWYDYPSWLLGIAAAVYAAGLLITRPLNRIAKISLWAGICVAFPSWLGLSHCLGNYFPVAVFSFVIGAYTALGVDAVYRLLYHPEEGFWRFFRPDGGGRVAVVAAWAVAIIAILGGLALLYWLLYWKI
jgi:hypothetical protein